MAIELWVVPTAITLVMNGIITFLPKITMRTLGLYDLIIYQACFFMVGAIAIQPFYSGLEYQEVVPALAATAAGAFGALGQIFYLNGISHGMLTHVSMISSLYPLVATILAFCFLGEALTLQQCFGILLGLVSILLLVLSDDRHKNA